jgi:lactoylglutathione lyase
MLRIGNVQKSLHFYTYILGMKVLRTLDQPEEEYSLTFLGYGDESDTAVLELTYNYGVTEYDLGNAYGHVAIGVEDIHEAYKDIKWKGGEFSLNPVQLKGSNEIIAFITDPDGYQVELIQR